MGSGNRKTVLVIDAQGGGVGRQLIAGILRKAPHAHVLAVGTNAVATSAMLRAGAHEGATGENSVLVASRRADVIVGPMGIVMADAMLGEVTPAMAQAVAQSPGTRVLIPFSTCDTYVAGSSDAPMAQLVSDAVRKVCELVA